jgi:uncharacterized membrane protein
MEIKSPSEMIADVTNLTDSKKRQALMIRTKSTVNGAFWGGSIGLMISFYKHQNKYIGTLIGVVSGALISNILTVRKVEEEEEEEE